MLLSAGMGEMRLCVLKGAKTDTYRGLRLMVHLHGIMETNGHSGKEAIYVLNRDVMMSNFHYIKNLDNIISIFIKAFIKNILYFVCYSVNKSYLK